MHQRNVAIFADGEVDRSPTGSATSARTALLEADGAITEGQTWRNDSIVDTTFHARAIGAFVAILIAFIAWIVYVLLAPSVKFL